MRASTRSPMPATGPASRLLSAMRMRGAGPCSSSQVAGLAMNSPSASRETISSTVTGGRCRAASACGASRRSARHRPCRAAAAFRAMRSPPLTPKARAISRLPASPVAVARKSRISCLEGSLPAVLRALGGSPLRFSHLRRSACRLLDGLFVALCALACRLLGRLLLGRALGVSRGDQRDRLVHA